MVHSGQANGGHYYSFIQNKNGSGFDEAAYSGESEVDQESSGNNWYKFDDGDVSEFKMDDDELRNQCFGGDYTGEVYDNIMKRMAYKKQKRWWNAYILFYQRLSKAEIAGQGGKQRYQSGEVVTRKAKMQSSSFSNSDEIGKVKVPGFIMKSVHKKNIKFLHHRHHFSVEYFQFVKKLIQANIFLCQGESTLVSYYCTPLLMITNFKAFSTKLIYKEQRRRGSLCRECSVCSSFPFWRWFPGEEDLTRWR